MDYVLPNKSCCSLNYSLAILSGAKKGLKYVADDDSLKFKKHHESLHLKFATANDWIDYLDDFPGWDKYIPNYFVNEIKKSKAKKREDRGCTGFDN